MCYVLVTLHLIIARGDYVDWEVLHVEKDIPNAPFEFHVYETD